MSENPDFEQKFYSRTAESKNKIGYDSIKLLKYNMIDLITRIKVFLIRWPVV